MELKEARLPDLYRALDGNLERLDHETAEAFTARLREIEALITWAPGMIDPLGQAAALSLGFEGRLEVVCTDRQDNAFAELHDALISLRTAIKRHDDDLDPGATDSEFDD
ncbi:MAG: hypothetical protein ACYCRH_02290 [Acidiferrobacteraceae bacterium]